MPFERPMGEAREPPSYLRAWLTSQANQAFALSAAAAGVILSFPLGWIGMELAAVAFIAAEVIASMYVPSMGTFRAAVDRRQKAQKRQQIAEDLGKEIRRRCAEDGSSADQWQVYGHMQERIKFLHDMARNRDVPLTAGDMDRMEDACLDYLGLWLADLSMEDRTHSVDAGDVERRLKSLDDQIGGQINKADLANLEKARADLQEIMRRRGRLGARKAAVEAKLLSIPDTVEEIYHTVVTAPASGSQVDRLQEAIHRLQVEEDLEAALNSELGETAPLPSRSVAAAPVPRQATPAKARN